MKKAILLLLICLPFADKVIAQTLASKIELAYRTFASDPKLKYASVSFSVLDAKSGNPIFARNENTGLAPGSTLKVVTAATALNLLGEDFTLKTEVFYTGEVVNGTLNGNIVIKGEGDPTLGSNRWSSTSKTQILNKLLFALQQKGIHKISGEIIADVSNWDSQSLPIGWIWQDIGNYYGAGTSPLCWGENFFELSFNPGKSVGDPVQLDRTNNYPFLDITNELTTGNYKSGDNVYAYSAPYTNQIFLRGTYGIDLNKKIGLSLPNPALALAFDIAYFLNKNGYETKRYSYSSKSDATLKETRFLTITSPPLKEIIYWFNQKSVNLYGEQLLRVMAGKFGKSSSTVEGVKGLQKYWEKKGLQPDALNVNDASGLSPADRITSLFMAKTLVLAKSQPWFGSFFGSLPTYNNLKMKSGTIGDVLAYTGYAGSNQDICFSLIVNNYTGSTSGIRQSMFKLLDSLK